jgi:hypothetical protein
MLKQFEIVPRPLSWDVVHNEVSFRAYGDKREAIRTALALGRMQLRLGDEAEVVLRDASGQARAKRRFAGAAPRGARVR